MSVTIALVNEQWEPLSDTEVEAFDVELGTITEKQTTNTGGIATFEEIDFPLETIIFKPRTTRGSGPAAAPVEPTAQNPEGKPAASPDQGGRVHIQLLGA